MVEPVRTLKRQLEEIEVHCQLGDELGTEAVEADLEKLCQEVETGLAILDFRVMLGGPNDHLNAFLQVTPGAGGIDACDWAGILVRMYKRWAQRRGFEVEQIEYVEEREGGIRGATLRISGEHAFGYLKAVGFREV